MGLHNVSTINALPLTVITSCAKFPQFVDSSASRINNRSAGKAVCRRLVNFSSVLNFPRALPEESSLCKRSLDNRQTRQAARRNVDTNRGRVAFQFSEHTAGGNVTCDLVIVKSNEVKSACFPASEV